MSIFFFFFTFLLIFRQFSLNSRVFLRTFRRFFLNFRCYFLPKPLFCTIFFFPSQTRKLCFFRGVFNRSASFTTIGLLYKNLSLDPTENLQDTSDAFGSDLFMSLHFETELPYLSNPVLTPAVSSSLPESILVPCF